MISKKLISYFLLFFSMEQNNPLIPQCKFTLLSCSMTYKGYPSYSQAKEQFQPYFEPYPITNQSSYKNQSDYHSFYSNRYKSVSSSGLRSNKNENKYYGMTSEDQKNYTESINSKMQYYSINNSIRDLSKTQHNQTKGSTIFANGTARKKNGSKQSNKENSNQLRSTKKRSLRERISIKNFKLNQQNLENYSKFQNAFKPFQHIEDSLPKNSIMLPKQNFNIIANIQPEKYQPFVKTKQNQSEIQQKADEHSKKGFRKLHQRPSQTVSINYKLLGRASNSTNTQEMFGKTSILKRNDGIYIPDQTKQPKYSNRRVLTQQSQAINLKNFQSQQKENKNLFKRNTVVGQNRHCLRSSDKGKQLKVSYCINQNKRIITDNIHNKNQFLPQLSEFPVQRAYQNEPLKGKREDESKIHFQKKNTGVSSPDLTHSPNLTNKEINDQRFGRKFKTLIAKSCKRLEQSLGDQKTSSNHISIVNNSFNSSSKQNSIFNNQQIIRSKDEGDKIFQNIRMLTSKNLSLNPLHYHQRNIF